MKAIYITLKDADTLTGEKTIQFSDVIAIHCNHKALRVYRALAGENGTSEAVYQTEVYKMSEVLYFDAE